MRKYHARFLEGWATARSPGYSVNFHAQFLEGWTGAIPSGYSVRNTRQGKMFYRKWCELVAHILIGEL